MNICDFIKDSQKIYAHIQGFSSEIETLEEHSSLSVFYLKKILKEKNIEPLIDNLSRSFFENESSFLLLKKMLVNAVYLHDIGKVNKNFQSKKMKNSFFKDLNNNSSRHSEVSAKLYFDIFYEKIKDICSDIDKRTLLIFLCINMYIISKHHGHLSSYEDFKNNFEFFGEDFDFQYEGLLDSIQNIAMHKKTELFEKISRLESQHRQNLEESSSWKSVDFYIYARLLFSLIVSSDFYATSQYMSGLATDDFGLIDDIEKYYSIFRSSCVYKNIQKYSKNRKNDNFSDINEIRSELFLEAQDSLLKNTDKNIFYLEAPTGSGKTNTAINLSMKLLEKDKRLNKIFYVFPFNSLVEQTKQTLFECFDSNCEIQNNIGVINSLTPMLSDKDKNSLEEDINYEKFLQQRQFLHYPIILTTHIKFFDWLFSCDKHCVAALFQLSNSVVVLDEIQSYKNSIWKETAIFLQKYSKLLNIKIIIMSATLPMIGDLSYEQSSFVALIESREKYFKSKFFKNRVTPDFSLLNNSEKISDKDEFLSVLCDLVIQEYNQGKKVLVEFIKKKTSFQFFKLFHEKYPNADKNLLSGDDNLIERKNIIDYIKTTTQATVLISTQVIEAGVDIDMDVGFKDISILDSEEQFAGRINRSCKKSGSKAFFFNFDDAKMIYKNDKRKEYSLLKKDVCKFFEDKDFQDFYKIILCDLQSQSKENNDFNIDDFRKNKICPLNFFEIEQRMRLISNQREYTVFLNHTIDSDGMILEGDEVWAQYKALVFDNSMSYAKKRVLLSNIASKLNFFTYRIRNQNFSYQDSLGDIFYIDNGEDYFFEFADGKTKFDRSKFEGKKAEYEFI